MRIAKTIVLSDSERLTLMKWCEDAARRAAWSSGQRSFWRLPAECGTTRLPANSAARGERSAPGGVALQNSG